MLDLINAVLESHDEPLIQSIQVLNPTIDPTRLNDKQVIFDIKAKTDDAEPINIEIQIVNQYNWRSRSLYYWSKMFTEQLEKGESYRKLQKTISISFLNYNLFDRQRCHSLYEIFERHDKQRLSDHLKMYYIEIPKLKNQAKISPSLHNWLKFLTVEDEDDLTPIRHTTPALEEACDMLTQMSNSDDQRAQAEARRKAILDYNTNIEGAWEDGKKEGVTEGIQLGRDEGIQLGRDEGIQLGRDEGIQLGRDEGVLIGEIKLIKKMLSNRFGTPSPEVLQKLENATAEELDAWSDRILEAKSIEDVFIH